MRKVYIIAKYHLLTITKVKIITLFTPLLYAFVATFFYIFAQRSLTQHVLDYGAINRNLSTVFVEKGVFVYVNNSKHSNPLTWSLLQQIVISIAILHLLPQQTTSVGNLHTHVFSLLFISLFCLSLTLHPTRYNISHIVYT